VLVAKGNDITPPDLPDSLREEAGPAGDFMLPAHRTLAEIERMAIVQALERTNWNKQEAAAQLGLYRPTLYSKMRKHEIRDQGRGRRTGRPRTAELRSGGREPHERGEEHA
jgi:transcriptional regulator of acetoin/glycerol metabolism